jgi:phosphatidylinositol-3-phosphatase
MTEGASPSLNVLGTELAPRPARPGTSVEVGRQVTINKGGNVHLGSFPRVRLLVPALIALAALAFAAVGTAGSSRSAGRLKHVFVIVLENHSKNGVIGDPNTPQITALANEYGVAGAYYGVTHPSEPNYVAMIAGDNFGINNDDPNNRFSASNLVDQLESSGHTWAAYMESMPSAGYLGDFAPGSTALYASKHNPFVLFDDIRSNPARLAKIKPFTALAADLNGPEKSIPDFSFIVPNQCHDMHGGVYSQIALDGTDGTPCPYGSANDDPNDASLKQKADAFVAQTVQTITSSKAWSGNSAIFVVADESDYNGDSTNAGWADASGCCDSPFLSAGSISPSWPGGVYGGGLSPAIVITRNGPRGYVSSTPYNHYSLLTTIEENWKLGYLGHAGDGAGGVVAMNDLLGP